MSGQGQGLERGRVRSRAGGGQGQGQDRSPTLWPRPGSPASGGPCHGVSTGNQELPDREPGADSCPAPFPEGSCPQVGQVQLGRPPSPAAPWDLNTEPLRTGDGFWGPLGPVAPEWLAEDGSLYR